MVLCTAGGFAISQVRPEYIEYHWAGALIGAGLGGLMVAIDEMLKGFSLRAFSATTFGLGLGTVCAWMIDNSGLFENVDEQTTRWIIRLCLFLAFGYIGMVLAMRSNKEDFSLIIPYVRFAPKDQPEQFILLDTSVIIDGRIAELIEAKFIDGLVVVPRFVLKELQQVADSQDPSKRTRGQRGLEMLHRIQRNKRVEVKIHEADYPEETGVDMKLIRLAKNIRAKLFTNDANLIRVAELQSVNCVNLNELAKCLRVSLMTGDAVNLKIVREGRDKGQGVGYLSDGTMIVVNNAQSRIGQQVDAEVQSTLQTGAGVIVFADLRLN
ncbi:MAG: TRAM domain-containing protein [Verrucomicrobiota bacterium]